MSRRDVTPAAAMTRRARRESRVVRMPRQIGEHDVAFAQLLRMDVVATRLRKVSAASARCH
jgi:hypothetical protein